MPRPKRTKIAPSTPAPRSKRARQPVPAPALPAPSAKEKKPFDDMYDVSDPDDRVVTNAQPVRKDNGKEKAGASSVSKERVEGRHARHTGDHGTTSAQDEVETGRGVADTFLDDDVDLGSSSPAVEMGRREHRTPGMDNSIMNFRRRPRQPSILGRGPGRGRSSSVESNLAEDNGLMSVGRTNTSVLSMANFKRRPRQPSIMGRNHDVLAPSSMALEMDRGTPAQVGSALKMGNFKRRAREPSILGTAEKKRPEQPFNFDDDDEDDFNPEDESTPLNLSKTRNMASSSAASSSISRKRKLSAIEVPQSSPILPTHGSFEAEETIPATAPLEDEEETEEEDEPDSPDLPMPSIETRAETPELMSETMAPPQSSSPTPSSPSPSPELPIQPYRTQPRGRRVLRDRTPPPRTQDSPISSPPSLTHSPNRPPGGTTRARPQIKKSAPPPRSTLSTAALQALLPRRRRRGARDPFDINSDDEVDTSGLGPDDDELTHLEPRARTRRPPTQSRTPAPSKRGPKPKPTQKASTSTTKPKRTYGTKANPTSDKENETHINEAELDPNDSLGPLRDENTGNGSSENSEELEKRVGKELKDAARKFKEVDQWEMVFEDVTASSSSPRDAR